MFATFSEAEAECVEGSRGALRLRKGVSRAYAKDGSYSSVRNGNKFNVPMTGRVMPLSVDIATQMPEVRISTLGGAGRRGRQACDERDLEMLKTTGIVGGVQRWV